MAVIALRPVADEDLDALFEQMRDPEGVRMAAFTTEDPDDRNAFDAHMARVRSSPDITMPGSDLRRPPRRKHRRLPRRRPDIEEPSSGWTPDATPRRSLACVRKGPAGEAEAGVPDWAGFTIFGPP